MLIKSNAKINLGLCITDKRTDGFHDIESIFLPIPWFDKIEIKQTAKTSFSSNGIEISGSLEDNLCMKAYYLLKKDYQLPELSIHLEKNIPIGAGLGGGSSDAAFVLKGLNQMFDLQIETQKLERYSDQLGSDCSFFIQNKPAFVSGKGEKIEVLEGFKLSTHCLIVYPNIHISTKEAYSLIKPKPTSSSLKELIKKPKEEWTNLIKNDFEDHLNHKYSALQELRLALENMGAYFVSMSGSGSTFFAFFDREPEEKLFNSSYLYKSFHLNV